VLTGTFSIPRKEMQIQAEEKGFIVNPTITSTTSYFVVGIKTESKRKIEEAKEYKIDIFDEEGWNKFLQN
jgi:NAD-dependent DNA ligase